MSKRLCNIALMLVVFLSAICIVGYSQEMNTIEQAKTKMITHLFKGDIGKRALYGNPNVAVRGTKIASWREPAKVAVDKDSWFFFVDEQPGANWEHDAQYVLVDKQTGAVKSVAAKTPPMNIMEHNALNKEAEANLLVMRDNLKIVRDKIRIRPFKIVVQKKYAVVVSGGWNAGSNYARYWNDISFVYKALKQKYNFTDAEIYVLYANGTHAPNEDLDGDGVDDVDYSATKANLTAVMNGMAKSIPKDGKFFFYSTNHGGSSGGNDAYLYLWGEWITDKDFGALTKNIKCGEAIYTMEQCYSGGMIDDILTAQTYPCGNPKVCAMSACKATEVSWACDTEGNYDEYVYHWTSAIFGKTPTGVVVNADANKDGKVTMSEAHEYAKTHDSRSEHPMIGSCITGACDTVLHSKIRIIWK